MFRVRIKCAVVSKFIYLGGNGGTMRCCAADVLRSMRSSWKRISRLRLKVGYAGPLLHFSAAAKVESSRTYYLCIILWARAYSCVTARMDKETSTDLLMAHQ